jgi:hypothetical protein
MMAIEKVIGARKKQKSFEKSKILAFTHPPTQLWTLIFFTNLTWTEERKEPPNNCVLHLYQCREPLLLCSHRIDVKAICGESEHSQ